MKKIEKCVINLCDDCQKQDRLGLGFLSQCVSCHVEYCSDCDEKLGRTFPAGVNFSGHGDVYFCNKCIVKPQEHARPVLHAYMKIQALRSEGKTLWDEYEKRKEAAEKDAKSIFEKLKK